MGEGRPSTTSLKEEEGVEKMKKEDSSSVHGKNL